MATVFTKDGQQITSDFAVQITAHPQIRHEDEEGNVTYEATEQLLDIVVPFGNLFVADDATLSSWGVTKEEVVDVPATISDRQFFQQLAIAGLIQQEDALAAVKVGTIPAPLAAMVAAIPDATDRFSAEMLLSGATIFERNHPLTVAIGAGQGMSTEQIDDFFRAASAL